MSLKVILVACVTVVALADRAPVHHHHAVPTYQHHAAPAYHQRVVPTYHQHVAPTYHAPAPVYHAPVHYKHQEYPTVAPKYNYNYGVADGYSGANFGHSESRDGYKTEGSYNVDLPDGRKQIFKYVDNGDGLVAEVTYEGEAQHPEYKPTYKPAPYHAPPRYSVY
ncbi:cuticle protein 8-like [Penaeus japonicus]|uniref:cuticle protein 8-like n=1 Tax=Penaeus japonicus TaxID=27405 RepID=UPI001C70F618|nr:cuticle protein 8-like [Penaeus japonicus]